MMAASLFPHYLYHVDNNILDRRFGGARSLARRKIGIFSHALNQTHEQEERLQVLPLPEQRAIGRDRIWRFEQEVLRADNNNGGNNNNKNDCTANEKTTTTLRRQQDDDDLIRIRLRIQQAAELADIEALVRALDDPLLSTRVKRATRLDCLRALERLLPLGGYQNRIVNADGIRAIASCMTTSSSRNTGGDSPPPDATTSSHYYNKPAPVLLRVATALLLRLAFVEENNKENLSYYDLCGNPHHNNKANKEEAALDFSVLHLLCEAQVFDYIRDAVLHNWYFDAAATTNAQTTTTTTSSNSSSSSNNNDDELASYERTLAFSQLRACFFNNSTTSDEQLFAPPHHHQSNATARKRVIKRFFFLRSCMASLLHDTTITEETLGSILLNTAACRRRRRFQ